MPTPSGRGQTSTIIGHTTWAQRCLAASAGPCNQLPVLPSLGPAHNLAGCGPQCGGLFEGLSSTKRGFLVREILVSVAATTAGHLPPLSPSLRHLAVPLSSTHCCFQSKSSALSQDSWQERVGLADPCCCRSRRQPGGLSTYYPASVSLSSMQILHEPETAPPAEQRLSKGDRPNAAMALNHQKQARPP